MIYQKGIEALLDRKTAIRLWEYWPMGSTSHSFPYAVVSYADDTDNDRVIVGATRVSVPNNPPSRNKT